jgi:flagella basal body P-ring formation protein FlgA
MIARTLLAALALLATSSAAALAQSQDTAPTIPILRAHVEVSADVVRIGDVIDNAGDAAQIAIYRAPDLGTTGSLPTDQVIAALRAHQVIGVDTRNLREISVTRLARTLEPSEIEHRVAEALEHRAGLGDARNLQITFNRGLDTIQLAATNDGPMRPVSVRYEPRSGRFDVIFEIANETTSTPTRLRFGGTVVDTVEAAVLTRDLDRNEIVKTSDITMERRPRAEVGRDVAPRNQVIGMQMRRAMHSGQALRSADLSRPDLVQRDQPVTIVYQTAGITLTIRGKALENGAEGDVVNVANLQSKRTFPGVVIGRGRVSVGPASAAVPVAVAANINASAPRNAE